MTVNRFFSAVRTETLIASVIFIFAFALQSCEEDESPTTEPSFIIEGEPSGLSATIAAKSQSYVVRSNRHWEIVPKTENTSWVTVFPTKGDDDGIFKISIAGNAGLDERVANFAFVVDGVEQPALFSVEQEGNVPTLTLSPDVTIPYTGGNAEVSVTTNAGEWNYTLSDASWLTEVSKSSSNVTLSAPVNNGPTRSVTMTVTSVNYPAGTATITVQQEGIVPVITLPEKVDVASAGGNFEITLASNVAWSYSLSDVSWLSEVSKSSEKITLMATANSGAQRSVVLTASAVGFPGYTKTVTLTQDAFTVLEENFDWLAYGSAVPYTTTGETIITSWTTEQQAKGWTSTLNPISNDKPLYARQGFVKLGKTNYGGDIISPKLSAISGTKNVKVTFKAVAYLSAAGTVIDSRVLVIEAIGAGTTSTGVIMVENVPNTQPQDNAGVVNDVWADERAFSFTVTGATSDTQIRFLAKAFDLRTATPTTNRIFLDDIKIEIVE